MDRNVGRLALDTYLDNINNNYTNNYDHYSHPVLLLWYTHLTSDPYEEHGTWYHAAPTAGVSIGPVRPKGDRVARDHLDNVCCVEQRERSWLLGPSTLLLVL